jgi:hypothetical protein
VRVELVPRSIFVESAVLEKIGRAFEEIGPCLAHVAPDGRCVENQVLQAFAAVLFVDDVMCGTDQRMNRYRIAALKPEFDGRVKLATRRVQFRDSYVPDFSSRLWGISPSSSAKLYTS